MLSRLRKQLRPLLEAFAKPLVKAGLTPTSITVMGILLSVAALAYATVRRDPLGTAAIIAVSAFLDALDGAAARIMRRVTRAGAFLDSLFDRIADFIYFIPLLLFEFNPILVLTAAGLAEVISYIRARGESLGVREEAGTGVMERGERVISLVVLLVMYSYSAELATAGLLLLVLLEAYTVFERALYNYNVLKSVEG